MNANILTLDIPATTATSYPIIVADDTLSNADYWAKRIDSRQVCIVSNELVAGYYLDALQAQLSDKTVISVMLEDGEAHKTLDAVSHIIDALMQARFNRDATIIALGGGIVGDVAGYAAASYQRGIHYIQVPTSLLAQVDSSVGGKTGVNHPLGKNMIGAFYQPQAVMIDVSTLTTLAPREFSAGMAEVIKYGLINDPDFFHWLENNIERIMTQDSATLIEMIAHCCQNKADIVAADEREAGQRALLNLGHTFGHALEALTHYQTYKHGEAIAIGMRMAAELSRLQGWLSDQDLKRMIKLLDQAKLPYHLNEAISSDDILATMRLDKKVAKGRLRLVLMQAFGHSFITSEVTDAQILQAIERSRQY